LIDLTWARTCHAPPALLLRCSFFFCFVASKENQSPMGHSTTGFQVFGLGLAFALQGLLGRPSSPKMKMAQRGGGGGGGWTWAADAFVAALTTTTRQAKESTTF
jgi:hypothetical protein